MEPLNPYAAPQIGSLVHRTHAVPNTLPEILNTGFQLYFDNLSAVVILTVVVWAPLDLVDTYLDYYVVAEDDFERSFQLSLLITNVIGLIPTAGVMAIGATAMRGGRATWWTGLLQGLKAWPKMFATRLVVTLVALLGFVAFLFPGFFVLVRAMLAEPIAVIEHLDGIKSPKRSFELTQGKWWQFAILFAIIWGFFYGAIILLWIPLDLVPALDHWLVTAAFRLLISLLEAWPLLTLVAAYWSVALPRQLDDTTANTDTIKGGEGRLNENGMSVD